MFHLRQRKNRRCRNVEGKTKKISKKVLLYVLLIILAIIWIIPIFTLVATALKHKKDFMGGISLFQLPDEIAWDNFYNAITQGRLLTYMKNDLIVSFLKVPLGIFVGSLAAFSMTRLKIKHSTGIFVFFLIGMMLPMQTALVPINMIYSKLGLLNTYFGLFYVYIGFGLSYCILIMRGFMKGIPKDIDEAAYIDGCNKWRLFYRIILPVSKPAIATLFITDFLSTWNEYLLASVIINDNAMKTVPVGIMTFVGEHGTDYGYLCAGVLVSVIPVMVVYLVFQRYFVEGMAGAVKS
ncbi:MAG TPA: carbohydrate ABC transporter permease [Candidatus Blautia faecigallinarum]|uniref:Carbohydrate ABC transporter permease n=1 Tax=Candidatus Blautia faecigallinarum TaxID=2838488 RepID=A0A9D2DSD9_9FIRM|nr:carbohydrate ABC transporter permease [Candidatus Blautia faecigallinarum]